VSACFHRSASVTIWREKTPETLEFESGYRFEIEHVGECLAAGKAKELQRNPEGRYLLYRVGDAVSSRNVHAAIYDSLRLCKSL